MLRAVLRLEHQPASAPHDDGHDHVPATQAPTQPDRLPSAEARAPRAAGCVLHHTWPAPLCLHTTLHPHPNPPFFATSLCMEKLSCPSLICMAMVSPWHRHRPNQHQPTQPRA